MVGRTHDGEREEITEGTQKHEGRIKEPGTRITPFPDMTKQWQGRNRKKNTDCMTPLNSDILL